MTTPAALTAADQFTIATTLNEDPEINFFVWRINVEDVAANSATLIEPTGLLTTVMTDTAWHTRQTHGHGSHGFNGGHHNHYGKASGTHP
jgi:hypothetical protein